LQRCGVSISAADICRHGLSGGAAPLRHPRFQ
jgi:hypothetical protein